MIERFCGNCKYQFNPLECGLIEGVKSKGEAKTKYEEFAGICGDYTLKTVSVDDKEPEMKDALDLLNEQIFKCPSDSEELLVYEDGIYKSAKPFIWKTLEDTYGDKLKRCFVEEATAHLQRANIIDREEVNKQSNILPMKNGLFNLLTGELKPFDSEQVFTYKLDVNYDLECMCPSWLNFISEIVAEEDIPLLQELMGYCLLPSMPLHKMFWLYGNGRNGKGVIVRTLEAVLGADSCGNLNLSEFREARRFSLCHLYGKLLNTSSEPPLSKYGLPTTILKMVTGEDTIQAELKGKDERLVFKNVSKLFILGNRFPKVEDNSLGWWDRVIVLNFPNSFEGNKCVPNIEKNWMLELSGVFNWMLEGLYRIRENNGFSSSKSTEETKAEFMKISDPFNAWIIERCEKIPSAYITREEALEAYFEYCDYIGADRDSKRGFYEKMRQTPQVKDVQKKLLGQRQRVFEGLTLKMVPEVPSLSTQLCTENNIEGNRDPSSSGTLGTFGTESSKLESLRNWIRTENVKQPLLLSEIKDKIGGLGFIVPCEAVLRRLFDGGDLIGVDV